MIDLLVLSGQIEILAPINYEHSCQIMNLDNIPQKSEKLMNQVTSAVEKTGQQVASQVSNLTNGQAEEITEEAIQAAVDQALDVIQVAGDRVREKNFNAERVTLEVAVGVVNIAHLKVTTDIPSRNSTNEVNVELS